MGNIAFMSQRSLTDGLFTIDASLFIVLLNSALQKERNERLYGNVSIGQSFEDGVEKQRAQLLSFLRDPPPS